MEEYDGYKPCTRCGSPIDWSHYGGRLMAVDPDGGHHLCPPIELGSYMECICGTHVYENADGSRCNAGTGTPHVHRPGESRRQEVAHREILIPRQARPFPAPTTSTEQGRAPLEGIDV